MTIHSDNHNHNYQQTKNLKKIGNNTYETFQFFSHKKQQKAENTKRKNRK